MTNVMIVEDEALVRIGLKSIVDWTALGMQATCDKANGAEALEAWRAERHGIIITDIRMPVMDGLELMRRIRETDRRTRFIVLTCLDEFDILKQAMELDITAYILKLTSTQAEVEEALRKAARELDGMEGPVLPERWVDYNAITSQLLRDYLIAGSIPAKDFTSCMEQLKGAPLPGKMAVAAFRLPEGFALTETSQDPHDYKLHSAVVNLLQKRIKDMADGHAFFDQAHHYLVLLYPGRGDGEPSHESNWEAVTDTLRATLRATLNVSVAAGVGDPVTAPEQLPECYRQAVERLEGSAATPYRVTATLDYIARNYQQPISIQDAAEQAGVSAGHLAHLLARHTGSTFNDLLNRLRIDRAKRLLMSPGAQIAQVGSAVGIPNTTYFTRLFRRYAGSSPTDFRKELGL